MAENQAAPSGRVSLTKKHLGTEEGAALLALLGRVIEDGRLSDEEVKDLAAWLEQTVPESAIPGVQFLREEIAGVLADGVITDSERRLLRNAVLRVLPPIDRERAKSRVADAVAQERQDQVAAWNSATERQRAYIRDLGGVCPDGVTKDDASELIDRLLASRPTVRQRMVLRFWDRLDLLPAGVEGVSAWMDQWYAADPDHLSAWELWKLEARDAGGRSPEAIDRVALGVGRQYLARVKAGKADRSLSPSASQRSRPTGTNPRGCLGQVIAICILLMLVGAVWWVCP
jgi:hypothetical protein